MWVLLQVSCTCCVLRTLLVCSTALPWLAKARHGQGTVRCIQAP